MKKILAVLFGITGGALVASSAMAFTGTYPYGEGINGSPHDLSATNQADKSMGYPATPADSLNRICIFCHAPHNAYKASVETDGDGNAAPTEDFNYLPLWNHTLQTDVTYKMYDPGIGAPYEGSKAAQSYLGGLTMPGGSSLLCLSCHDGSVAVNSYGNDDQRSGSKSTGGNMMGSAYMIGKDKFLSNHHPIGFDYDAVEALDPMPGGIRPASTFITAETTINDHLFGAGNTMMECATCHSVHNTGNKGEALLWRSDENSQLCLTCHDKGEYTAP